MSYTQTGGGTLRLGPDTSVRALRALGGNAHPELTVEQLADTLARQLGDADSLDCDGAVGHGAVDDPDAGPQVWLDLSFCGTDVTDLETALTRLAGAGVAGTIDLTGPDGAQAQYQLTEGALRLREACSFFPADPTPGAFCVALTAEESRSVLALAAGVYTDDLPALIDRLTATLP